MILGVCRVCELIDNDFNYKKIKYCKLCKVYMCKDCERNLLKRGQAAIKEQLLKLKEN